MPCVDATYYYIMSHVAWPPCWLQEGFIFHYTGYNTTVSIGVNFYKTAVAYSSFLWWNTSRLMTHVIFQLYIVARNIGDAISAYRLHTDLTLI